jgi:hypothetical protein
VELWKPDLVFIQDWMVSLPRPYRLRVVGALDQLAEHGPLLGRPLVDRIHGSRLHNLKELRPVTNKRAHLRVLFVFTPSRSALMLTAGDKWGRWETWYDQAIAEAEANYARYITD